MPRTKIVCTLGPASETEDVLRAMLHAGMDVVRLNFSHGTHEDHARRMALVRRLAKEEGRVIAILQDLQGPKLRIGRLVRDLACARHQVRCAALDEEEQGARTLGGRPPSTSPRVESSSDGAIGFPSGLRLESGRGPSVATASPRVNRSGTGNPRLGSSSQRRAVRTPDYAALVAPFRAK